MSAKRCENSEIHCQGFTKSSSAASQLQNSHQHGGLDNKLANKTATLLHTLRLEDVARRCDSGNG
jgi:hypothetical protein